MTELNIPSSVTNEELIRWVTDAVELCKPDSVHFDAAGQREMGKRFALAAGPLLH